jgi:hypothetical protein
MNANPSDALRLIDQLDDMVHRAKLVPLSNQVRLDRDQLYAAVDQIRAAIIELAKRADAG